MGRRNQYSGVNPVDEVIIELLRQGPRRKVELEQEVPASNVYHRCLQLMASGRIVAIREPLNTVYALSEAEKEKAADALTSANNAMESNHEQYSR